MTDFSMVVQHKTSATVDRLIVSKVSVKDHSVNVKLNTNKLQLIFTKLKFA